MKPVTINTTEALKMWKESAEHCTNEEEKRLREAGESYVTGCCIYYQHDYSAILLNHSVSPFVLIGFNNMLICPLDKVGLLEMRWSQILRLILVKVGILNKSMSILGKT